jgi:hypothetical protein
MRSTTPARRFHPEADESGVVKKLALAKDDIQVDSPFQVVTKTAGTFRLTCVHEIGYGPVANSRRWAADTGVTRIETGLA